MRCSRLSAGALHSPARMRRATSDPIRANSRHPRASVNARPSRARGLVAMCDAGERVVDVRRLQKANKVLISLTLADGSTKRLERPSDEAVSKAFARLRSSIRKDGRGSGEDEMTILLRDASEAATHEEAWRDGGEFVVGSDVFRVRLDAPSVGGVVAVDYPMVGFPCAATAVGLELCEQADVEFRWLADGEAVGVGRVYTPTEADLGRRLSVQVIGARHHRTREVCECFVSYEFINVVRAPDVDRADALERLRVGETSERGDLRVMTYNVLADAYSHTWKTMFPYFREDLAKAERRLQLVLQDILASDCDIVALQEVDKKWHELLFEPVLASRGYVSTTWCGKSGQTMEGSAMFFRDSIFSVLEERVVKLNETKDREMKRFISDDDNFELANALGKITTVAQLVKVSHKKRERVMCCGNVHLFFHPGAMHIRIIQAHELVAQANEFAEGHPLMLCGDFNGEPEDGIIRYLKNGQISAADEDWIRGSLFRWGGTSSRDAARSLYYILDDGRGYETDRTYKVQNSMELRELVERGIFMSLSARTLNESWGAKCKCSSDDSGEGPIVAVKKHVKAGCTFKNCHAVAAFTLRREIGLDPGLSMNEDELLAAKQAFASMKNAQAEGFDIVSKAQIKAMESVKPAEGARVVPVGCGATLSIARPLTSAGGYPEWTNYVGGFVGALDYVWCSEDFNPRTVAPPPPMSAVLEATALPNAQFPSDHVPVVVGVDFRTD